MPPAGRSASVQPTRPSRGSARVGTAAITRCPSMVEVRSLAECTAASARPSLTAASTSPTKTPCPPMRSSGDEASSSPRVRTTTISTSSPGSDARSASATSSVWRRASGEPRVARRNVPTVVTIPWPGAGGRPVRIRRQRPAAAARSSSAAGQTAATGRRGCGGPRPGARREACRPSPSTGRWVRAASSPWRRGSRCRPAPTPTR